MPRITTGEITLRYLERFPDMRSRPLAKLIQLENPSIFPSFESIRSSVRRYRGKNGEYSRKGLINRRFIGTGNPKSKIVKPNILLFDIETLPGIARYWGVWKTNINPWQIIHPGCMLSWSAKWLFEPEVFGDIMTSNETLERDDKRITTSLWNYMEEADIVIAHNGKAFDISKINTQFLLYGLGQPAPYKVIDTCLVARKYFAFEHNKLDYLAEHLGLPRKIETEYSLWVRCESGEQEALDEMFIYNKQDVAVLEEVYVKLRPWIKDHPNLALFIDEKGHDNICGHCMHEGLINLGWYYTSVGRYESFRCPECGAIRRSRVTDMTRKTHPHVLQNIS